MQVARFYNPARNAESFNHMVNTLFGPMSSNLFHEDHQYAAPVNIAETEGAYILAISAAGFSKEQFSISQKDNKLVISGKLAEEVKMEGMKHLHNEFNLKSFERVFRLPKHVQVEAISAQYENGILRVTLPKSADKTPEIGRTIIVN